MLLLFLASLILITFGSLVLHYVSHLRTLNAGSVTHIPQAAPHAYRPMLRLLADDDMRFLASNPRLRSELRARRRMIFRSYLRCLSKDYSRLLGGVRWIMVNSDVDRPDLAAHVARQQRSFALAMCRIEWKLALHAMGLERVKVDISDVVFAVDNLVGIVNVFSPARA